MKDALIMRKYLLSQSAQICIKMFAKTQSLQLFQKVLPVSVNKILQVKSFTQQASAVKCVNLRGRTLLRVTGPDAKDLLQGLTTNDMQILTENNRALYTMFLNNQGRILYDVICYRIDPGRCEQVCYFLECDTAASQSLVKHLKMYKLRKKVDIALYDEAEPWAIYDGMMGDVSSDLRVKKSIVVQDPRIPEFGSRVLMHHSETIGDLVQNFNIVDESDYQKHRFLWGVSEGIADLPPEDSLPLESNLAFMNGVSFSKGCYLGQELTARTHYTGVIRKRIMPVDIISSPTTAIEPGASVKNEDGKNAGKFRGHIGENGLALVRVALSQNKKLFVKDQDDKSIEMQARIPDWWPSKEELVIQ